MSNQEIELVNDIDVRCLKDWLEGFEAEALKWLVAHDWIKAGQGLESLSIIDFRRISRRFEKFKDLVLPEQAAARKVLEDLEQQEKDKAQRLAAIEKKRKRRMDQWLEMRPIAYVDISLESAPKPRKFNLVAGFFSYDKSLQGLRDELDKQESDPCGIFAHGAPGTGKTASAWQALRNYWNEFPSDEALFVKSVDFSLLAKSRYANGETREEFQELFDNMLAADLLILDDAGTEKLSESVEEVLFKLLDTRTENGLATIITANYTPDEWAGGFSPKNQGKIARRLNQFFVRVNFDKP
jgi:DNA replication protein DnaC